MERLRSQAVVEQELATHNPRTAIGTCIVVVGTSGSGKTTMAANIARKLSLPHVELDALHWEPNWIKVHTDVLRGRVEQALGGDGWVVDGNYSMVRDLVWSRAETVVWLDYSLPVTMRRITQRTLRRLITRQVLWNGNRESFRTAFLSRDSILLWALTTHNRHRTQYPAVLSQPEHAHLKLVRLRTPRQARLWLQRLAPA